MPFLCASGTSSTSLGSSQIRTEEAPLFDPTSDVCGLCEVRPSTTKGEHVFPVWWLKEMDKSHPPPLPWTSQGQPIMDRVGRPVPSGDTRVRVFFPACETCNTAMAEEIEIPAKEAIRRLKAVGWAGTATAEEWRAIGIWFAKTILLGIHPRTRYSDPRVEAQWRTSTPWTPPVGWLASQPLLVPDDVSVYLFRMSLANESAAEDSRVHWMPSPTFAPDGTRADLYAVTQTTDGIGIGLLIHPGWTLNNPMVASGEAIDAIRGTAGVDLGSLPLFGPRGVGWACAETILLPGFSLGRLDPWVLSEELHPLVLDRSDLASWGGIPLG